MNLSSKPPAGQEYTACSSGRDALNLDEVKDS